MTTSQPGYGKTSTWHESKKRPRKGSYAHVLLVRLKRAVRAVKDDAKGTATAEAVKKDTVADHVRIKEQLEQELNARYYIQFQRYVLQFNKSKGLGLTPEDAEEIANDTCKRIVDRIETYRERGSKKRGKKASGGRNWMMTICKNITIDRIKEMEKKEQAISLDKIIHELISEEKFPDDEEETEGLTENELKLLKIRKLMQTLPEKVQKILIEGEGKEYPEALELLKKAVLANPDFLQ